MFDAKTGTLTFEQPPTVIGPSLTRDQFLASPLAAGATTLIKNEPYHSWALKGPFRSAGLDLNLVLWFHGQKLTRVSLMDRDPRFGTSWAEYSLEKEMARMASHDAWLSRVLPKQRTYPWGRVWSGYDERGGFSDIIVIYGADK
jgi:hypothetical protein